MSLTLQAPSLDFHVDVRLRDFDGRWLAVAEIGGESEIGLGSTPGEAVAASLCSLGPDAVDALMAGVKLDADAPGG